jgi:hypothetical protein
MWLIGFLVTREKSDNERLFSDWTGSAKLFIGLPSESLVPPVLDESVIGDPQFAD